MVLVDINSNRYYSLNLVFHKRQEVILVSFSIEFEVKGWLYAIPYYLL
ncbi:MAG: hypothetical protein C0196_06815 [Dictyoglomus turgidum]|nr:MAG: hypothetical protein C0196_06815 [Dictyoglomus turgidum]